MANLIPIFIGALVCKKITTTFTKYTKWVYIYIYVYVYVYMYICVYICINIKTSYACIYTLYICTYICIYMYIYTHRSYIYAPFIYIYIYVYTYHMHVHVHAYRDAYNAQRSYPMGVRARAQTTHWVDQSLMEAPIGNRE